MVPPRARKELHGSSCPSNQLQTPFGESRSPWARGLYKTGQNNPKPDWYKHLMSTASISPHLPCVPFRLETQPNLAGVKNPNVDGLRARLQKMTDHELATFGRQMREFVYIYSLSLNGPDSSWWPALVAREVERVIFCHKPSNVQTHAQRDVQHVRN
jgi:hypothetical protein